MRVLIVGAGVAGPTLAYWLAQYGADVTLIEKAPALRSGGYVVDFWGLGFEVASRMGLLAEISRRGYVVREVRVVDRSGKKVAGFSTDAFARVAGGRFVTLPRSDLAALIYGKIEGQVETVFGDSVALLEQNEQSVHVRFARGGERDFDLVVGADGLHSRVRDLVFGPGEHFERFLGYQVAAFEAQGYQPRDELVYLMYTEIHQQITRFSMRGDRTLILFTFAADSGNATLANDTPAQKALLRRRFGASGWECPRILDAMDAASDLYFDRVSQIDMGGQPGSWTRGRVTLLGDAASCVSLLAGQGTALAMGAAYILAGELHRAGSDYASAFSRYEQIYAPFVRAKQKAALRYAGVFAPRSRSSLFLRNQVMNLLRIPWVADLTFAREFRDNLALPAY